MLLLIKGRKRKRRPDSYTATSMRTLWLVLRHHRRWYYWGDVSPHLDLTSQGETGGDDTGGAIGEFP